MAAFRLLSFMFCTFCLLLSGNIHAQEVTEIQFEGLKRTKLRALSRLTMHGTGGKIEEEIILADLRRLRSFPSVVDASFRLDTLRTGISLVYVIEEGITRFPIVFLGGLKDNVWFEVGYKDLNWQGNGDQLSILMRKMDGRLGGKLFYHKAFVNQTQWGYGFQAERFVSKEPLYFGREQVNYFYDQHNVGAHLSRNLKPESQLQLGLIYFIEDYQKVNIEQPFGPQTQRDLKQLLRLGYECNLINRLPFQPSGFSYSLSSEFVFQKDQGFPFYLLRGGYKYFMPAGKNSLFAGQATLGYSTNKNTPFAPFVVDSRLNIRGIGNRVDRGTAACVLNLEYRQLLLEHPWVSVQGIVFSDLGSWRTPGGSLNDLAKQENIRHFVGGGIRLISLKAQQAVLRIDYGFGLLPRNGNGFVVGLGQYF